MLKALRAATVLSIAVLALYCVSTPTKAQDAECFMVTSSGKIVNLSNLCGDQSAKVKASSPSVDKDVFQAPIKRRHHGIPVIDVTFNGTQTFEMLVDTGATETVLTPQVAKALGVAPIGKVKVDSPTDRGVEMSLGRIASIEVAGAVVKNNLVAVAPALDLGLLGENFFKNYDVTVKENVVEFRVRQP